MNQKLKQYKKNSITTSSPERILLMLYNAAILNVKKAKEAIAEKKITDKCKFILKAQDIIHELASNLDFKNGGELSERLNSLYDYISHELTEAHIKNIIDPLNNVEKVLITLNEGWEEAVKNLEAQK